MNRDAVRESMRIGTEKVTCVENLEVLSPYTEEVIGTVPMGRREHVSQAFDIAASYRSKLSVRQRQDILFQAAQLISERRNDIAEIITAELGISIQHARYESDRAHDVFKSAASIAALGLSTVYPGNTKADVESRTIYTLHEPVSAISAITPFNHPLNMVAHKIAPSIATNNCLVCKPAEATPLSALLLADILYEAGLPREMFQVVTGLPEELGDEMICNDNIDVVTFTGGVRVGNLISEKNPGKALALELGGNDPLIVLDDLNQSDLQKAAEIALKGSIGNSGQRCTAIKRILVQESVADSFVQILLEMAKNVKFGNPNDPNTELGCVINSAAAEEIEGRVLEAESQGAKILYHPGRQGALLPPIVIDEVPYTSTLVQQETFGPVISIVRVPNDDDSTIKISNSTPFGLSAGICGHHMTRVFRYIHGLDVGTVNVWQQPGYRTEITPFGGIKSSGNGVKEGVLEAMKFFTRIKTYSLPI